MVEDNKHPLKVFLCHASGDKPQVRALYKRLIAEGVDAWLDQEKLLPGQSWRVEIPRAVRESDVVVICLSNNSITKEGYIQKEIKFALDVADEKPEGSIFLIPARLEECVVPEKLSVWQWVDLFEGNGFVKLLRSLKLRADRVGALIESASYMEDDTEAERRLNQLYTEGLAAFYTEDWDKSCQRFQAILSERPNHKNAAEKLEEAERQRYLAQSYDQATEALRSEDWMPAIRLLEDIVGKFNNYKDASQLLKNAKKQKQLGELYDEAKTLHAAQKWQAVLKVFDQISVIDPTHQDIDGLLPSAQKELAELNRLAKLNALYINAINEMDSGRWYEARLLLEQIHKSQTGYLETERLLRKVEDEIIKMEEIKKRDDQIHTLYEQANGLVRSRNWQRALEKMEEIQNLDHQFVDKDGIIEKVNSELAKEERKAQKQNELAAKYSEAVKLLKKGEYQESLDKWQEIKSVDAKYPDRQRIQKVARSKLSETGRFSHKRPRLFITKPLWKGVISLFVVGVVVAALILSRQSISEISIPSTATTYINNSIVSVTSTDPYITDTSEPSPKPSSMTNPNIVADSLMYDDFDDKTYNGNFNTIIWGGDNTSGKIAQNQGLLAFDLSNVQRDIGLNGRGEYKPTSPIFVESKMMLDPTSKKDAIIYVGFAGSEGGSLCGIIVNIKDQQNAICWSEYFGITQRIYERDITLGTWHVLRVEIYPDTMTFVYKLDGEEIGSYIPQTSDRMNGLSYSLVIHVNSGTDSNPSGVGYADYVKVGTIEESETKQTAYRWDFENDVEDWGVDFRNDIRIPKASNGYLTFKSIGNDPYISSPGSLNISAATDVITIRMRLMGQGSYGAFFFVTDKDNNWDGAKYASFAIESDGAFHIYDVIMPPAWQGIITQLRLDPVEDGTTDLQVDIDYISIHAR